MHSPTFPTSPLAVIHTTIMSSVLASGVLLLAGSTLFWAPILPPATLPEKHRPHLLPVAVSVVVLADLLWQGAPSFRPARIGVYAGLVELTEAAAFFRSDPSRLHAKLLALDVALVPAPDGSTLVALEAVLAALHEHGPDPGGHGPAQSLRD